MRIVVTVRAGCVEDIFVSRPHGAEDMVIVAGVLDYDSWSEVGGSRTQGEYINQAVSPFGLLVNQAWGDGTLGQLRKERMISPTEDFFPTLVSAVEMDARSTDSILYALIPISSSLVEDVLAARNALSVLQGEDITYSAVERKDVTPYWIQKTPEALERYICFGGKYLAQPAQGDPGWVMTNLPQTFYEGIGDYDGVVYEECVADVRDGTLHVEETTFWWSGIHKGAEAWEVHTAALPIEMLLEVETKLREEGLL